MLSTSLEQLRAGIIGAGVAFAFSIGLISCTGPSVPSPASIESFCKHGSISERRLLSVVDNTQDGVLKGGAITESALRSNLHSHGGVIMHWSPDISLALPHVAKAFPDHRLPVRAAALPMDRPEGSDHVVLIYLYSKAIKEIKHRTLEGRFWFPFYSLPKTAVCRG